jgi:hypothetical protein
LYFICVLFLFLVELHSSFRSGLVARQF